MAVKLEFYNVLILIEIDKLNFILRIDLTLKILLI